MLAVFLCEIAFGPSCPRAERARAIAHIRTAPRCASAATRHAVSVGRVAHGKLHAEGYTSARLTPAPSSAVPSLPARRSDRQGRMDRVHRLHRPTCGRLARAPVGQESTHRAEARAGSTSYSRQAALHAASMRWTATASSPGRGLPWELPTPSSPLRGPGGGPWACRPRRAAWWRR